MDPYICKVAPRQRSPTVPSSTSTARTSTAAAHVPASARTHPDTTSLKETRPVRSLFLGRPSSSSGVNPIGLGWLPLKEFRLVHVHAHLSRRTWARLFFSPSVYFSISWHTYVVIFSPPQPIGGGGGRACGRARLRYGGSGSGTMARCTTARHPAGSVPAPLTKAACVTAVLPRQLGRCGVGCLYSLAVPFHAQMNGPAARAPFVPNSSAGMSSKERPPRSSDLPR